MDKLVGLDREFYKGKKVFLTGHTGFKGSWLSLWLLMMGAEVTGYALEPKDEYSLFNLLNLNDRPGLKSIIGDVRDYNRLSLELKGANPDIVIHMAAQPLVRESYISPRETYETNVMGTVNLLNAVRDMSGIKSVINVTTDKVYRNVEKETGYKEEEHLCGQDPYSNSKSCSELVTESYRASFFYGNEAPAISTARSGNVIGGGDFAKDRILPDCFRAAKARDAVIVRNPYSVRPYQHVLDCLSGYLLLGELQYKDRFRYEGAYNFGPNEDSSLTTGELVDAFCESWNSQDCQSEKDEEFKLSWVNIHDGGPHEAGLLRLDISKAISQLNWKQRWSIDEAVNQTVLWGKAYLLGEDMFEFTKKQIEVYCGIF